MNTTMEKMDPIFISLLFEWTEPWPFIKEMVAFEVVTQFLICFLN